MFSYNPGITETTEGNQENVTEVVNEGITEITEGNEENRTEVINEGITEITEGNETFYIYFSRKRHSLLGRCLVKSERDSKTEIYRPSTLECPNKDTVVNTAGQVVGLEAKPQSGPRIRQPNTCFPWEPS
ncbi:hypothetical protein KY289_007343 [Solanum tuberosum]|nr:hypothetical protein KY289_007343 [Solanum tuberosum]